MDVLMCVSTSDLYERQVGMRRLRWHNFGHNRYVWESGIMLAF